MLHRFVTAAVLALPCLAQMYVPKEDPSPVGALPYTRYFTEDRFGRQITFYITKPLPFRAPMVAFVLGSGAHSHFALREGQIVDAHRTLRRVIADHAVLLIVEKPGVAFLGAPRRQGTAEGASEEFRYENTLERWTEAVTAAIKAARTLPFVEPGRMLLMGHSEGARVASRVASDNGFVSHVALLAGGGATHLFALMESARSGALFPEISADPDARVQHVLRNWAEIQAHPDDTARDFLGHPFRWWSSYAKSAPGEELMRSKARIYLAHGTMDRTTPVAAFDVLYSHLLANGADVVADRVAGADHGFLYPAAPERDGQRELFTRILAWFLAR